MGRGAECVMSDRGVGAKLRAVLVAIIVITSVATVGGAAPLADVGVAAGDSVYLEVEKTVSNGTVTDAKHVTATHGETVTFIVSVTNDGMLAEANVTLNDTLPSGLDYVSATATAGSYDAGSGQWTFRVDAGETAVLDIVARANATGTWENVATAVESDPGHQGSVDQLRDSASVTVLESSERADLTVSKSSDKTTVQRGDWVTFAVNVTNEGPNATTGVEIIDALPDGLNFVSASAGGTYDPATRTVVWAVGDVPVGVTETLTLVVNATTVGPWNNVANVTASDVPDPDSSNDEGSATVTVESGPQPPAADLNLSKTANGTTVTVGDHVRFVLELSNAGPNATTGVEVTDLLPGGLDYVSDTPTRGVYDSGTGVWSVGNLSAGATGTLTLVVNATTAGSWENKANVTATDVFDPDLDDNRANATVTVESGPQPPTADLTLSKTSNRSTVTVGDRVAFELELSNAGPNATTDVVAEDVLPAGLEYVSGSPGAPVTYYPGNRTLIWSVGDLPDGASKTLTLVVNATTIGSWDNVATVTASGLPDPVASNDEDSATVTVESEPAPTADLSVTKTANASTVTVGNHVQFIVTLSNAGPNATTGVEISDLLPTGLSYVSDAPSTGIYDPGTGVWSVGDLSAGATETLSLTVNATAVGSWENVAGVTASDLSDPDALNDVDSATVTVESEPAPSADLAVTKTANVSTVTVGDDVRFTVTVTNTGPDATTGVVIEDVLPTGLEYVSTSPGATMSYDPGTRTLVWTVGNLSDGANETLTLLVNATTIGSWDNVATVTASDLPDPVSDNDEDVATVSVTTEPGPVADLAVTKGANASTVTVGDHVLFTVTVTNAGPNATTGVVVRDVLPTEVTYSSSTPSHGSYDAGSGNWTIGAMGDGDSATLKIVANASQVATVTNDASVIATDVADPTPGNDHASATVQVEAEPTPEAELSLHKSVDDSSVFVGDTVTFTLRVTNNGRDEVTGVVVVDQLPDGLVFDSIASGSNATYDPGNRRLVWDVGDLRFGGIETLTYTATATDPGQWENDATVTSAVPDPLPGNNDASATVAVAERWADLGIFKHGPPTVSPGETIVYTVIVENRGPDDAPNVDVEDWVRIPSNWPLTVTTSTGTHTVTPVTRYGESLQRVDWLVGDLAVGASATMTMAIDVPTTALHRFEIENVADVSPGGYDPDWGNNHYEVRTSVIKETDLRVSKSVDDAAPAPGEIVEFTVEVTNDGPDLAYSVFVGDVMDPGLDPIPGGSTASQGTYSAGGWYVGTLQSGATATLTIAAMVSPAATPGAVMGNLAEVFPLYDTDPDLGNNLDEASVIVSDPDPADLGIEKTVANATATGVEHVSVFPGENVTYTFTVTNFGPGNASKVIVTDVADNLALGEAWDFVPTSNATSQGIWNWTGSSGVWIVGTLGDGASATLTVTGYYDSVPANATPPGTLRDLATVTSASDPNPTNDADTANVTVWAGTADLAVEKTVQNVTIEWNTSTGAPDLVMSPRSENVTQYRGIPVLFTVNVTNLGPDAATGVVVNDTVPSGLGGQMIGPWNASLGDFDPQAADVDPVTGEWTIDRLEPGEGASLSFWTTTDANGTWDNVAEVTRSGQRDVNGSNDRDTASVTVVDPSPTDITLSKTISNATVTGVEYVRAEPYENVTYDITVTNTGNASRQVFVMDPLLSVLAGEDYLTIDGEPAFVETSNATTQGVWVENATTGLDFPLGVWVLDDLDGGETATLTIEGQFTVTGALLQAVLMPMSPQYASSGLENTAIAFTFPDGTITDSATVSLLPRADVGVEKWVSNATVTDAESVIAGLGPEDPVNYTITVTNHGPENASNVYLVDPILGLLAGHTPENYSEFASFDGLYVETSNATTQGVWNETRIPITIGSSSVTLPIPGLWDVGSLATGSNATLTVTGHFNDSIRSILLRPAPVPNVALAGGTDDPDWGNNLDDASVILTPSADLGVEKTVSNATVTGVKHVTVALDRAVTFDVTVATDEPISTPVVVTDPLLDVLLNRSSGFVVSNATTRGGWYLPGNEYDVWYVLFPENETTATLSITGSFETEPAAPVVNTATVEAPLYDLDRYPTVLDRNPTNDADTATVTVRREADLSLTKAANVTSATTGDPVEFTVEVTNAGPNNATNVSVADALPALLDFVDAVPSQGSYDATNGTWAVGEIAVGANATLTLATRVNATTNATLWNVAEVAESGAFDPDSTPGNNLDGEDDRDAASIDVSVGPTPPPNETADLELTKTATPSIVGTGGQVEFTVEVTNNGPRTATPVLIEDRLPADLDLLQANATEGMYNRTTNRWGIGSIESNTTETLTLTVRTNALPHTTLRNVAEVVECSTPDTDSTAGNGDPTEDDYATADVLVVPEQTADLKLSKTVDDDSVTVGDDVNFTVSLQNLPDPMAGFTVTDVLPDGFDYVSNTTTRGTYDPNTGVWSQPWFRQTSPRQRSTTSETLTITATATQPGTWTNVAEITDSYVTDPNPDNDVARANVTVGLGPLTPEADLVLTKRVDDNTVYVGDSVTFTVTLRNDGPNATTGVIVEDALPGRLTYLGHTVSRGTYDVDSGIWSVGSVANGASATLEITASPNRTGEATNVAEVSVSPVSDPDTGDNRATATVTAASRPGPGPDPEPTPTPSGTDLRLSKRADVTSASVGDEVTFTVTLRNDGPKATSGVEVTDVLPAGFTGVSNTVSRGTYDPETGIWSLDDGPGSTGSFGVGASETLSITVTASRTGTWENVAELTETDVADTSSRNNRATATVSVRSAPGTLQADLRLTKTANVTTGFVGERVVFTLVLSNDGPDVATGVVVAEALPADLEFVSADPERGSYDATTGNWTIDAIAPDETATLTLTATMDATANTTVRNVAEVVESAAADPDSTPGNDRETEDDWAAVTIDVRVSLPGTPTPTPTPTVTPTATATPAPPSTATATPTPVGEPGGLNLVWLFLLLLLALLVLGLVEVLRRRGGI